MKPLISVVVPVYNEEGSVASLHKELVSVLNPLKQPYECIFINDGSTDNTLAVLRTLPGVVVIDLARNYGQSVALDAGFKNAKGSIIVTLDGDGQNDPHDIPKLLEALMSENVDVAAGWRQDRKDDQGIKIITRTARSLRGMVLGDYIHDSGCTLRAYRRAAIESIDLSGEMHRYLLALLTWKGFRIVEVPVHHRARTTGVSKYGYTKAVRGLIDLIYIWFLYRYAERPFHLFGYMGLTAFAFSIASFAITIHDKFFLHIHLNRDGWFFLTFFFLIMAIMMFSFGLVIDLLMRIFHNTSSNEKRYYVRDISRN